MSERGFARGQREVDDTAVLACEGEEADGAGPISVCLFDAQNGRQAVAIRTSFGHDYVMLTCFTEFDTEISKTEISKRG